MIDPLVYATNLHGQSVGEWKAKICPLLFSRPDE